MIGREAYHNPWWLASWDADFFGDAPQVLSREDVESRMCDYMVREAALHGTRWPSIARHMLGLRHGLPGARRWRQVWSDHSLKHLPPHAVMALAHAPLRADGADRAESTDNGESVTPVTAAVGHNAVEAAALG